MIDGTSAGDLPQNGWSSIRSAIKEREVEIKGKAASILYLCFFKKVVC
jgi:hypothetical protein